MFYEGAVWDGVEPLGGRTSLEGSGFGDCGPGGSFGSDLAVSSFSEM